VLDTTDGPMRVAAKYDPTFVPPGGVPDTTRSGELCTTPCVVDLPIGKYRLFFSATAATDPGAGDSDDLQVQEGLQVYRRAPGRYQTPTPADGVLPIVLVSASAVALVVGGTLSATKEQNRTPGLILMGVGIAGVIGGGIWAYDANRATQQDGASVVFQPGQ
jgi:hypothetical protein